MPAILFEIPRFYGAVNWYGKTFFTFTFTIPSISLTENFWVLKPYQNKDFTGSYIENSSPLKKPKPIRYRSEADNFYADDRLRLKYSREFKK